MYAFYWEMQEASQNAHPAESVWVCAGWSPTGWQPHLPQAPGRPRSEGPQARQKRGALEQLSREGE